MQYLVFDDMERMSEADVQRLLPLVSGERREKALRFRHLLGRWTTLKSYELLQDLLSTDSDVRMDVDAALSEWRYNEYGKPFVEGGPQFSISHCRAGVAVAMDKQPIGIDMETIRPYNETLARRVMNEEEMRLIDNETIGDEAKAVAFTRLWTQKEAVLKLRGTGIVDELKDVLVGAREGLTTWTNKEKGYCVSIAQTKE